MQQIQRRAAPEMVQEKKSNQGTRCMVVSGIREMEGEENSRKFQLSFSSEEPYERWWGTEILDHEGEAADLTRLNEIGCLLYNHNRDSVIGKVLNASIENGRGIAEVEFDTDEESECIYQKVKSGTLKGVSVGYRIDNWEEVASNKQSADGRFQGPCEIARRWTPFEISIVSVPADATVGVGREYKPEKTEQPEETDKRSFDYFEKQIKVNMRRL